MHVRKERTAHRPRTDQVERIGIGIGHAIGIIACPASVSTALHSCSAVTKGHAFWRVAALTVKPNCRTFMRHKKNRNIAQDVIGPSPFAGRGIIHRTHRLPACNRATVLRDAARRHLVMIARILGS
jgi:hypothetical protein